MPGTVLSSSPSVRPFISTGSLVGYYHHPHFTRAETETWRASGVFQTPGYFVIGWRFESGPCNSKVSALCWKNQGSFEKRWYFSEVSTAVTILEGRVRIKSQGWRHSWSSMGSVGCTWSVFTSMSAQGGWDESAQTSPSQWLFKTLRNFIF